MPLIIRVASARIVILTGQVVASAAQAVVCPHHRRVTFAAEISDELRRSGIRGIEYPLACDSALGTRRFRRRSNLLIAASGCCSTNWRTLLRKPRGLECCEFSWSTTCRLPRSAGVGIVEQFLIRTPEPPRIPSAPDPALRSSQLLQMGDDPLLPLRQIPRPLPPAGSPTASPSPVHGGPEYLPLRYGPAASRVPPPVHITHHGFFEK